MQKLFPLWTLFFLGCLFLTSVTAQNGACWGFPNYGPSIIGGGAGDSTANLLAIPSSFPSPASVTDLSSLIAGQHITCAVSGSENALACWGDQYYSELLGEGLEWFANSGTGASIVGASNNFVPGNVAMGLGYGMWQVCGIQILNPLKPTAGSITCSLAGYFNEAGTPGQQPGEICNEDDGCLYTDFTPPTHTWQTSPKSICLGEGFVCAITQHGVLWCWGPNSAPLTNNIPSFISPTPNPSPSPSPSLAVWSQVACGSNFVVGLDTNNIVYWWPHSSFTGWTSPEYTPVPATAGSVLAQTVGAGYQHFCTISRTIGTSYPASLHCWGLVGALSGAPAVHIAPTPYITNLSTSVFAMAAFGGCVQTASPDSTSSPICWYADYYSLHGSSISPMPTPPPAPTGYYQTISGGFDYFCGTW